MPLTHFHLFEDLAHRYDLHTPAHHYGDDHAFALEAFQPGGGRILDVGCGTGVFIEKALAAGFEAQGIDIAEGMIRQAAAKVGSERVAVGAMEDIVEEAAFDGLCALSWVINYADDAETACAILARFKRAMRPGARLVVQTAHAPNMTGKVLEDREPGPDGQGDDITFLFQFTARGPDTALARYVYAAKSLGELVCEDHALAVANANLLARLCREVGFTAVQVFGSWRRDPLGPSISPWVVAEVPA